jgi:hypothetical protein
MYIDVDTSSSTFSSTPTYLSSITAPRGIEKMWKVFGAASVYNPSPTGFRLYLAKAGQLQVLHQDRWIVNYVGVETRFCQVSAWSKWSFACPCKSQKRSRTIVGGSLTGCKKPLLLETKPCHCKTAAPTPGPNSDEYFRSMPTPAPKVATLPSSPKAVDSVTDTVTLVGISKAAFTGVKQTGFKTALSATLGVSLQDIIVLTISAGSRRLQGASSNQASSVAVTFRVSCSTVVAARGVKEMLMATHFVHTLEIELRKEHVNPTSGTLSVRVSVPSVHTPTSVAKQGASSQTAPTAQPANGNSSNVKAMLYAVLAAVGLAYVVLGVCMFRKNIAKKNKSRQLHDYSTNNEETRPLAGDSTAGIVAPESESGGVFI